MREILFRGKSIKTGKWEVGHLTSFYDYLAQIRPLSFMVEHRVRPETVGQYTGLKDREGRRIFEGDIVRDGYGNDAKVWFDFGCFFTLRSYSTKYLKSIADECEVIGNIHDTPELLKGATE